MRTIILALLALVGVISTTSPVLADDTEDDIRCLYVGLQMAGSSDQHIKDAATTISMYYLGRLDSRTPTLDLEKYLLSELQSMTPDLFRSEATRCGNQLEVRGKAVTGIGTDMVQKGTQMLQHPSDNP